MKLLHPEVFQGSLSSRKYFEGWYCKHVSADFSSVLSIIPGVALNVEDPHAFIQVLDGISGRTTYIRYPLSDCALSESQMHIRIGSSTFSTEGMTIDIDDPALRLRGTLRYSDMVRYPSSLLSPGIMGWYSFVPLMECKHAVISMRHMLTGRVVLNGKDIDFTGGTGYIEKDWGSSFPESWVWIQGNTFTDSDASCMVSIAKIPWLGRFFIGAIAYIYVNGSTYVFATYNRSTVTRLTFREQCLSFELVHPHYVFSGEVRQRTHGQLHAPVSGIMTRMIKESADADISVKLQDRRGATLFQGQGKHGGLELIEGILSYFSDRTNR